MTRTFGPKGFDMYVAGFFFFFVGRFVTVVVVAVLDAESVAMPMFFRWVLAVPCLVLSLYTLYSVKRYFGMRRAAGADHFDESYRTKPFVKEGMFKYSSNSMYTFAILLIWVPGILYASQFGILLALFNHTYVWVHYFCLEKPDIKRIYG